jgi:hypothetical protein
VSAASDYLEDRIELELMRHERKKVGSRVLLSYTVAEAASSDSSGLVAFLPIAFDRDLIYDRTVRPEPVGILFEPSPLIFSNRVTAAHQPFDKNSPTTITASLSLVGMRGLRPVLDGKVHLYVDDGVNVIRTETDRLDLDTGLLLFTVPAPSGRAANALLMASLYPFDPV